MMAAAAAAPRAGTTSGRRNTRIVPITLAEANAYVEQVHRHNGALPAARFQCALVNDDGDVLGVAIAGLPKARELLARDTLEINRVCTTGAANACSQLYAACVRAGKALGFRRFVTYTLAVEDGASVKASDFRPVAAWQGGKWSEMRGTGSDQHDVGAKVRWEIVTDAANPPVKWPDGLTSSPTFDFAGQSDVNGT